MPLVRILISSLSSASAPASDAIDNTLYFNVSGSVDEPDYGALVSDLRTFWITKPWAAGRFLDIRAYNMDDPTPRPVKARSTGLVTGTAPTGPRQVALCLSYYADRNLPRQRGRIYLGPWTTNAEYAAGPYTTAAIGLAQNLADLGGINVDWSLWSPTTQTHTRINHAWVDNSWDIIRTRKVPASEPRKTWTGNG